MADNKKQVGTEIHHKNLTMKAEFFILEDGKMHFSIPGNQALEAKVRASIKKKSVHPKNEYYFKKGIAAAIEAALNPKEEDDAPCYGVYCLNGLFITEGDKSVVREWLLDGGAWMSGDKICADAMVYDDNGESVPLEKFVIERDFLTQKQWDKMHAKYT